LWLGASGWAQHNLRGSLQPSWPTTGNGNWVASGPLIDSQSDRTCVTVDPLGWVYGPNCRTLNWPAWENPDRLDLLTDSELAIDLPDRAGATYLVAVSIAGTSWSGRTETLSFNLDITLRDGTTILYSGEHATLGSGGTIELSGTAPVAISDISVMTLTANQPTVLLGTSSEGAFAPSMIWMVR
jgi:hypothetical protein